MGSDYAVWRRIKVIPFNITFKGKDKDKLLPQKLQKESEAILRWIVEGAVRYYDNGIKDVSVIKQATKEYRNEEDTTQQFVDDCVKFDPESYCGAKELYDNYSSYCECSSKSALTQTAFGRVLSAKKIDKQRTSQGIVYNGIRLK